jgi:hypothetical protein
MTIHKSRCDPKSGKKKDIAWGLYRLKGAADAKGLPALPFGRAGAARGLRTRVFSPIFLSPMFPS